ncbi:SGNH/GDSL hydrolase family protein [Companilactobacillus jidongensis]|uniref:SGNH/GDSL hydrolase family protein n=1 Tax=Companilactobacillus jidongensis TaxID=2486006 RepID=UPI000F793B6E|nr:SGNH/GDSL hydrolase family protein [Companilactobacillus jidongensis]
MTIINTWTKEFSYFPNIKHINHGKAQTITVFQPLAADRIRLLINNQFGRIPLEIKSIKIIVNDNDYDLTMNNNTSFSIASKRCLWSDWLPIHLKGNSTFDIEIRSYNHSIHTLGSTISTELADSNNYIDGDNRFFYGVSAVQSDTDELVNKIAFFGDSLTNQGRFTAPLAKLLSQENTVTANYGISGNRLLHKGNSTSIWSNSFGPAGVNRFEKMINEFNPNTVILLEGTNDLLLPGTGTPTSELPSVQNMMDGYKKIEQYCNDSNVKLICLTLPPFQGAIIDGHDAWSSEKEALRTEINDFILSLTNTIDLATFVCDDSQKKLAKEFDSGDHTHFSDDGGKLIAQFLETSLSGEYINY